MSILLDIGVATIFRWVKRSKEGKELKASRPKMVIKKIDPKIIEAYIKKHPDTTLLEMRKALGFSISALWYRIKQLGITLKKKSFFYQEAKKQERENFRRRINQIEAPIYSLNR